MSQMSQSSPPIHDASMTSRRPSRGTMLFMVLLMILVLGVVLFFTRNALRDAAITYEDNLSRSMTPQAQNKVAQLTVWFGSINEQTSRFVESDPVRLFASEVDSGSIGAAELLALPWQEGQEQKEASLPPPALALDSTSEASAESTNTATQEETDIAQQKPGEPNETDPVAGDTSHQNSEELSYTDPVVADLPSLEQAQTIALLNPTQEQTEMAQMATQAHLMLRQMQEYIQAHSMRFALLLNTKGEVLLSTGIQPQEEEKQPNSAESQAMPRHALYAKPDLPSATHAAIQHVIQTGQSRILPARLTDSGLLIMDMIFPVIAPLYVNESGSKVVGVMVMGLNISPRVRLFTNLADEDSPSPDSGRILQVQDNAFFELHSTANTPTLLPGWSVPAPGQPLPLALRHFSQPVPEEEESSLYYTLALPVPGTPLYVEQDTPFSAANAQYKAFQQGVLLAAGLFSMVAILLLVMLWWWLVGKRERAVAGELRALYDTVTRQNQILEGVNTTMEDAIVLTDNNGRFLYFNLAFARMVGEKPSTLQSYSSLTLAAQDVGQNIQAHMLAVQEGQTALKFMDALLINGNRRFYQVACAPFRDSNAIMHGVVSVYRDITDLLFAQERAQYMVNQTIHVFVRAIEAVDPYLRGQSQLMGFLATALAHCLGLNSHDATLRTAANLSQIGMIQLPHSLLTKTNVLSAEERSTLEKHVDYARGALEGIDFGYPVLEAITQMHERLDGSGYPQGLKDDDINVDARLLAVASTFCAVLRPRSYREAKSVEEALNILSSPKYDQHVVQALRSFLQNSVGLEFLRELKDVDSLPK